MKMNVNRNIIENSYYMVSLFSKKELDEKIRKNKNITNLKLQKLMYFVEAYYMVKNKDENYLYDTEWSAWDYGPVNKELYNHYKKFGSLDILLTDNQKSIGIDLPKENKEIIDKIYDLFGGLSAFDLVTLTHLDGSPWSSIYKRNRDSKEYDFEKINNSQISKEKTREWFEERFEFLFNPSNGEK